MRNNFGLLRVLFASAVLITHAHVLSGDPGGDLLQRATDNQAAFSWLAVRAFFVISGFLVYKSFERSSDVVDFLRRRFRRVWPALIALVLVTVFVIGPIFTYHNATHYFGKGATWRYAAMPITIVLGQVPYDLPGVFDKVPHPGIVNGSLWTIAYEVLFYLATAALFVLKRWSTALRATVLIVFLACMVVRMSVDGGILQLSGGLPFMAFTWWSIVDMGVFYSAGCVMASGPVLAHASMKSLLGLALVFLVLTIWLKVYPLAEGVLLPLLVISAAYAPIRSGVRSGPVDISYGTYLWGYPIQQMLMTAHAWTPLELAALSVPLAWAAGWLSWRMVERHFLVDHRLEPVRVDSPQP
ncbi:MAG: acyltransferase [Flavobacteriales bacterium]|nr:MAG: acyltransferase [Flavobacteriales bacterium]